MDGHNNNNNKNLRFLQENAKYNYIVAIKPMFADTNCMALQQDGIKPTPLIVHAISLLKHLGVNLLSITKPFGVKNGWNGVEQSLFTQKGVWEKRTYLQMSQKWTHFSQDENGVWGQWHAYRNS